MGKIGWGTNAATRELDEDLWHIINQGNLGLIWNRPGLSLRDRELIVMAVLVATGSNGVSHLMEHADAVGITDAQIKELILQTIPYSGQPRAIQAMITVEERAGCTESVLRREDRRTAHRAVGSIIGRRIRASLSATP